MPRVEIPVTDISRSGVAPPALTNGDATNDHFFVNADGKVFLEIVSSDAGAQTVEIVASPDFTADGLTVGNLSIAVPAGATRFAGPFRVSTFKQNSTYHVFVNPSVSNTIDFRAWRLPAP